MSYFSLMSTLYTLNYHSSWLFGIIIDVYKPRLHYLHSYPVILHGQWILSRRSRNVPLRYLMNILHSNSTRSGIFRNTGTSVTPRHRWNQQVYYVYDYDHQRHLLTTTSLQIGIVPQLLCYSVYSKGAVLHFLCCMRVVRSSRNATF